MSKVSVVIPIYNTEKYLKRCLDSVINQTLEDIEIILVDDASPDNAGELCDEFAKKDARIKVIHKENGGLGFARNSGIEVACGEFIAFLDSDDYVEEDMYEKLYNTAIEKNVQTCLCGHTQYFDDGTTEVRPNLKAGNLYRGEQVQKDVLLEIIGTMPEYPEDLTIGMSTCMGIYSLDVIKDNNMRFCSEREFISEDFMMNIDYYKYADSVYIMDTVPYYYCANGSSLSKSYKKDRFSRNMVMYNEVLRRLDDYEYLEEAKLRLDRTMLGFTRVHAQQICTHYNMSDSIKELKKMCNEDELIKLLKNYPYNKNPIKYKLFNTFMDKKMAFLLWLLIKLK